MQEGLGDQVHDHFATGYKCLGFEKPALTSSLENNECFYQHRGDIRATKSGTPNRKGGDVRNQAGIVADVVQVFCTDLSEAESSISKEFGKDLA